MSSGMLSCASSTLQTASCFCLSSRLSQPVFASKLAVHIHQRRHAGAQHLCRTSRIQCLGGPGSRTGDSPLPAPIVALEAASDSMASLVSTPAFLLAAAVGFSIIAFDVNNSASLHFLPQYIDQPAHAWVKANLPVPIKNLVAEKLISDLFITGGIGGWVIAGAMGVGKSGWVGVRRLAIALFIYICGGGSIRHGMSTSSVCSPHSCCNSAQSVIGNFTSPSHGHMRTLCYLCLNKCLCMMFLSLSLHPSKLKRLYSVDVLGDPFVVDQLKTYFQRLRPSDILNTYAFPSGHTTAAVFIMGNILASSLFPVHL